MDIIKAIHNKDIFHSSFDDLGTWQSWQVYLKSLFGLEMSTAELKVYRKHTGCKKAPKVVNKVSYVTSGRRSGKTRIVSILSTWIATSRDWSKILSPGEMGYIFIIANDREQAKVVKRRISGALSSSPKLRHFIKKETTWEIELNNSVIISVRTKDYRTLRNYTVLAAIFEETAFWRSEESSSPDYEILAAVQPAMLTVKDSMLISISSIHAKRGLAYDMLKKWHGVEGGPLVWLSSSIDMNPTLDKAEIDKQIKSDPVKYKAEYLSIARSDIESYLGIDDIGRIVEPGVVFRQYDQQYRYFAFCDPSGGKSDSMTLGISHIKEGLIILDQVLERKAPFSPESVVSEFAETLKLFKITKVISDKYAGAWPQESFKIHGIDVEYSTLSASQIYAAFIPICMNQKVVLLDNKRLKNQLSNLERKTGAGGKETIDHPAGSHDDLANAATGSIISAQAELSPSEPSTVHHRGLKTEIPTKPKTEKEKEKIREEEETGWAVSSSSHSVPMIYGGQFGDPEWNDEDE